jgi:sulfatase modifying factor 1
MLNTNRMASVGSVVATLLIAGATIGIADETPGLVPVAPEGVRSVNTAQGYMVPYTITIPGTQISFDLEPIPGGKFMIGSPASESGRSDQEGPQFEVVVEPFWMARHEVTWAEYKAYMSLYTTFKGFELRKMRPVTAENQAAAITAPTELYDPSFTFELGENPRQPAVTMTQYAAKQYTKWLSGLTDQFFRLPSEAEWEYACRAGSQTAFHFGDDSAKLGEYAWYFDNADEKPHVVGGKKPNAWGLFDMHGNVAEWVLDELLSDGYSRFEGKSYSAADAVVWPKKEYPRVVKGGSWDSDAKDCRAAARLGSHDVDWKGEDPNLPLSPWWYTSDPSRGVGFRIIRPLQAPAAKDRERYWEADVDAVRFAVQSRLEEGRGVRGLVDRDLPAAIAELKGDK